MTACTCTASTTAVGEPSLACTLLACTLHADVSLLVCTALWDLFLSLIRCVCAHPWHRYDEDNKPVVTLDKNERRFPTYQDIKYR